LKHFVTTNGAGTTPLQGDNAANAKREGIIGVASVVYGGITAALNCSAPKASARMGWYGVAFSAGYVGGSIYRVYGNHKGRKQRLE
jgi:hypothetical protein